MRTDKVEVVRELIKKVVSASDYWLRNHVLSPEDFIEVVDLGPLKRVAIIAEGEGRLKFKQFVALSEVASNTIEGLLRQVKAWWKYSQEWQWYIEVKNVDLDGDSVIYNVWRKAEKGEFITAKIHDLENKRLAMHHGKVEYPRVKLYTGLAAKRLYLDLAYEFEADINEVKFDEGYYNSILMALEVERGLYYTDTLIFFLRRIEDSALGIEAEYADVYAIHGHPEGFSITYLKTMDGSAFRELIGKLRGKLVPKLEDGFVVLVGREMLWL